MPLYKKTGQLLNNPLQLTAREEQVSSLRTHAGLCITERHYAVTRHDCSHSIITHSDYGIHIAILHVQSTAKRKTLRHTM